MSKHTPEPWCAAVTKIDEETGNDVMTILALGQRKIGIAGLEVLDDEDRANIERIIACVNACAGYENPQDLRSQRDELLKTLKSAAGAISHECRITRWRVEDAIDKAEGRKVDCPDCRGAGFLGRPESVCTCLRCRGHGLVRRLA